MGSNQRMRSGRIEDNGDREHLGGVTGGEVGSAGPAGVGAGVASASDGGGGGASPAGVGDPRGVVAADLATLIPTPGNEASAVEFDREFARRYPRLWVCLTAGKRVRSDKPRAPGELAVRQDGAVWVITLTMPEELYSLQAESPLLTDVFASLEARLTLEPIPWRKASKYAKRRQLSPDKKELAK